MAGFPKMATRFPNLLEVEEDFAGLDLPGGLRGFDPGWKNHDPDWRTSPKMQQGSHFDPSS